MNSLEFIEKEIRELKFQINYIKSNMKKYIDFRTEGQLEIDMKQLKINHLQQIKSELEAWEVVQGTIVEGIDGDGQYCFIETVYFTGEKGKKVTKGLYYDETR